MRNFIGTLLILTVFSTVSVGTASAQFRSDTQKQDPPLNTADAMKGGDFFSTLLDPARFSMHQTYSMSMMSSSIGSYGLSMFTNTFSYKASDALFISADVSAVYSPFSSFGSAFQNQMNGIYLTNARLDWKLGENTLMRVEYMGGPPGYGYSPFGYNPYNPFSNGSTGAAPMNAVPAAKLPGH
jgi:hypothetical protein